MRTNVSTLSLLCTTALLSAYLPIGPLAASARAANAAGDRGSEDRMAQAALASIAQRERRLPSDLEIVGSATASFPLLGASVSTFKLVDRASGAIFTAALDADGREVDLPALRKREQAAYDSRYGRLDPTLAGRLGEAPWTHLAGSLLL